MTISKGFLNAHKLGKILRKNNNFKDGLCAFGVVTDIPKDYSKYMTAPCHAALNRVNVNGELKYMVDALYPYGKKLTPRMAKAYARYILEKSPYSKMFAEKNIKNGWARGYFLYNVDIDSNILTGGAVALRMLSETPNIPLMWNKLVAAGTNPDVALLAAHMVGVNKGGDIYLNRDTQEGHKAMVPSQFTERSLADFVDGKYRKYGIYKKRKRYGGFNGMWGEGHQVGDGEDFGSVIYERFLDATKDVEGRAEIKVALFNHQFNWDANEHRSIISADKGFKILSKILNNYLEESLDAKRVRRK